MNWTYENNKFKDKRTHTNLNALRTETFDVSSKQQATRCWIYTREKWIHWLLHVVLFHGRLNTDLVQLIRRTLFLIFWLKIDLVIPEDSHVPLYNILRVPSILIVNMSFLHKKKNQQQNSFFITLHLKRYEDL